MEALFCQTCQPMLLPPIDTVSDVGVMTRKRRRLAVRLGREEGSLGSPMIAMAMSEQRAARTKNNDHHGR